MFPQVRAVFNTFQRSSIKLDLFPAYRPTRPAPSLRKISDRLPIVACNHVQPPDDDAPPGVSQSGPGVWHRNSHRVAALAHWRSFSSANHWTRAGSPLSNIASESIRTLHR